MSIKIRPAEVADVAQIAAVHSRSAFKAYSNPDVMNPQLLQAFWNEEVLKQDWHNYLNEAKKDQDLMAFVAIEDNNVVGVLRANNAGEHEREAFRAAGAEDSIEQFVHFKTIYIDPNHQKKGIGKKLINHVAKKAVKNGKPGMLTITAGKYEDSPRFFKTFGADCVGKYDLDMKEHYDTTTSAAKDSKLVCKIWFMNSKEVMDKSTDKEERIACLKAARNKQLYYLNRARFMAPQSKIVAPIYAMAYMNKGKRNVE